ncbi:hypothetical protein WN943_026292 [Citrus x changshan-huyou]
MFTRERRGWGNFMGNEESASNLDGPTRKRSRVLSDDWKWLILYGVKFCPVLEVQRCTEHEMLGSIDPRTRVRVRLQGQRMTQREGGRAIEDRIVNQVERKCVPCVYYKYVIGLEDLPVGDLLGRGNSVFVLPMRPEVVGSDLLLLGSNFPLGQKFLLCSGLFYTLGLLRVLEAP